MKEKSKNKIQICKLIISGRVQGVGYRMFIKKEADNYNIKGTVQNINNGEVEINIIKDNNYDIFYKSIEKGSLLAKVENIVSIEYTKDELYKDFTIIKDYKIIQDQKFAISNLVQRILNRLIYKLFHFNNIDYKQLATIKINHLVIIPDGNRRWAKSRGLPVIIGHSYGLSQIISLINFITNNNLNIKHLSIWAFSSDNFKRSGEEVSNLIGLFKKVIIEYEDYFIKNNIRVRHIGRRDRLDSEAIELIDNIESKTKDLDKYNFSIIIDYDGRDEIINAVNNINLENKIINKEDFSKYLYTKDMPDPDLIIRTSGEYRTSGLFLWQSAYSEWYFSKKHFPDFNKRELVKALIDYNNRNRRFGK